MQRSRFFHVVPSGGKEDEMVALYLCYAGIGGLFVGLTAAVVHQWNVFQKELDYPLDESAEKVSIRSR